MAEIGKQNELEIVNVSPQGLYLDGGDDEDILLPKAQVPKNAEVGDVISVFVYCDSEDRPIATTKTPLATVGQFASLKVLEVNRKIGAFLDWGLEKDLLLPFGEQNERVQAGDQAVVYIKIDPQNGRIVASAKLRRSSDMFLSSSRSVGVVALRRANSPSGVFENPGSKKVFARAYFP